MASRRRAIIDGLVTATSPRIHTDESRVNSRLGSGSTTKSCSCMQPVRQAAAGLQLLLGEPGREHPGQVDRMEVVHVPADDRTQRGPEPRVLQHRGDGRLPGVLVGQRLLQQLAEVEHLDAVVAQRLREPVVLLLGPVHPRDPVEQQLVVVPRGQPLELGARAVQQDRTEPAHLAVDVARHAATLSTRRREDRLGHPLVRPGRLASMGLLDDKVVVVTGAGRGIGRGEALECARQGAAVVLNEFDPAVGAGVVDEIKALGGSAVLVEGDVSDVAVADSLIATAVREFGRLDGLVNNAGVLRDRTLAKMTPEEWDTVIRVHLRGHYAPTHAALVHWREHGGPGHVVCTASTSGLLGNFGQSNYGAAKAGIAAFAQIVAQETARMGVTCNAIAPAARTRMTEGAYGEIFGAGRRLRLLAPGQRGAAGRVPGQRRGRAHQRQGVRGAGQRGRALPAVDVGGRDREPGGRWDPAEIARRIGVLFAEADMEPGATNGMARLRYTMTNRG